MILIESNKQGARGVHDSIKYDSIEKQVFDIFSGQDFKKVRYKIDGRTFKLFLDGIEVEVVIKSKVKIQMTHISGDLHDMGSHKKLPHTEFKLNKDITNQLNKFCEKIKKHASANNESKPIRTWLKENCNPVYRDEVETYLNTYFRGMGIQATFWFDSWKFFDGLGIGVSLHPKGEAPAAGVYMEIDVETGKIEPFWNHSTPRRTHGNRPETVEEILRSANFGEGTEALRKKADAIENLEKKVAEFDYTKCPKLAEIVEMKNKANELHATVQ